MNYCAPLGIPYSQFLSWPQEDQDAAIAWKLEQNEICPHCGTRDSDWRDAKTKRLLDYPPYEVVGHHCAGCVELANYREREDVKANSVGLYLRLEPTRKPERG